MTLYFVKKINIMWISVILPNYIIFGGNRKFLLTYLHYLQIKASLKAFNYRTMRKIDLLHRTKTFSLTETMTQQCVKIF